MCNCENCNGELCEAHDKEYEEEMKAVNEYLADSSEEELTQEDINAALVADLKDGVNLLSDEEKRDVLEVVKGSLLRTPKDRVIQEAADLSKKIDALHKYLKGYNSDGIRYIAADELPDATVYLLQEQEKAMVTYYNCLVARLSIWGTKKVDEVSSEPN